ncbi:MAG: sugar phosphate isomerase/epimerase [Acidobacteria bacterium]|nr:sugar phosphate isomerase/epimerase [Acidobacteriota bacterium]
MLTRRLLLTELAAGLMPAASGFWKTAIGLNGFGSSERVFNQRYELDQILKFARDEGFDGIEWWPFHAPYPHPDDDTMIQALRSKVESYGIRIFSIQTSTRGANPVHADPAVRRQYAELLKGQIDLARKLGCEAAGVWPPPLPAAKGLGEDEIIERLAESLRPAARHATDHGLILAIEGEPPLVINSPVRYQKLFAAVGMKEFKVIFDPSHFDLLTGGKRRPDLLLEQLGVGRVGYVQFTDGDGTLRVRPDGSVGTSKHLAAGQGKYDIPRLLKMLHRGGFRGWIQMDTWETEDPFQASRAGKKAVDAAARRLAGRRRN